jgi:hypothetical protein
VRRRQAIQVLRRPPGSRSRANGSDPKGNSSVSWSTTRWLWNTGQPNRRSNARGVVNLPAAARPCRNTRSIVRRCSREEELTAELLSAPAAALQQATEAPRATPDGLNNGASFNAVK